MRRTTSLERLVLVRHGESEWNLERRVQGQSGTGLTDRGVAQSERTAEVLADAYPDVLLAMSDLQRCRETAAPLEGLLRCEVRLEPGLRERDFGAWTGLLGSEIAEQDADRWKRWRSGEDVVAEIGGEDSPALVRRVVHTYRRLLADADGRTVICVTHGGPIWHGTQNLLGLDDRVLGGVANASITEIDLDDAGTRLASWNQVAHLPLELRMLERAESGKAGQYPDPRPLGF